MQPKMKTGRRPILSASIAHSGMMNSAMTLVRMATHSMVGRSIFTTLTA